MKHVIVFIYLIYYLLHFTWKIQTRYC